MAFRLYSIRQATTFILFGFGIYHLAMPFHVYGQADGAKLYQNHCVKCHGEDGKGQAARAIEPDIPDFTNADWQKKRTDAKLLESILDGKGSTMPAFRDKKLSEEQGRALVAYVRKFTPATKKQEKPDPEDLAPNDFERRFAELQRQFMHLQNEYRRLSTNSSQYEYVPSSKFPPVVPTIWLP